MWKALKIIGSIISILLTILGIGGFREDFRQWTVWLGGLKEMLSHELVRTVLVLIGVGLFLSINVFPRLWRKKKGLHKQEQVSFSEKPLPKNPLELVFQVSYFKTHEEGLQPLGLTKGNRKTFWIEIVNSDQHKDVQNVAVGIKRVMRLKETGQEDPSALLPTQAGFHRLKFHHSGAYEADFPPSRREIVDVVSATDAFTGSEKFRIEGDETDFYNPFNTHKIIIEVTAKNLPSITKAFFVYIDPHGMFKMVPESEEVAKP